MGRVRLKDVAERAKVDPSTASRVLSGRSDLVKDETAARVLEASRALGYTPNAFARALRTQRTGSIGVVLPEFSNPVYAAVIDGIEQRAAELGLSVVIDALRPSNPGDFARLVSDRAYIIEKGRIRYHGAMAALMADEPARTQYLSV